jgi:hypothetical protein
MTFLTLCSTGAASLGEARNVAALGMVKKHAKAWFLRRARVRSERLVFDHLGRYFGRICGVREEGAVVLICVSFVKLLLL